MDDDDDETDDDDDDDDADSAASNGTETTTAAAAAVSVDRGPKMKDERGQSESDNAEVSSWDSAAEVKVAPVSITLPLQSIDDILLL